MTTAHLAVSEAALPRDVEGSRSTAWWGMVWFIANEATLFAMLFVSYLYLRFKAPVWPLGGIAKPDFKLVIPMTVLLFGSTIPVVIAERGIKRGRVGTLKAGLAIAFVMGGAFLCLQAAEYAQKLKDFTPRTNAYGSIFYTITALHGFHVFVAVAINGFVQYRAWRGHFDEHRHVAVENAAMYWHFVDAVWAIILLLVYISPHLSMGGR